MTRHHQLWQPGKWSKCYTRAPSRARTHTHSKHLHMKPRQCKNIARHSSTYPIVMMGWRVRRIVHDAHCSGFQVDVNDMMEQTLGMICSKSTSRRNNFTVVEKDGVKPVVVEVGVMWSFLRIEFGSKFVQFYFRIWTAIHGYFVNCCKQWYKMNLKCT